MWTISEDSFNPDQQHHKETLFTIGNGYLSTRGAFEEGYLGDRRATFVHGIFDDIPIVFTELVNAPDWLPLAIYLDGERFSMDSGVIQEYRRSLDLKSGLLTRHVKWVSPSGKGIDLIFERFTSLADEHLLCLRCRVVPNYDGKIEFRLSLNGYTENEGFAHWRWVEQGLHQGDIVYLRDRTRKTGHNIVLAMKIESSRPADTHVFCDAENVPTRMLTFSVKRGEEITVEKSVGIATSRDSANPVSLAVEHVSRAPGWERAFEAHRQAWQTEWDRMDITIEGDDEAQLAVRSSLFQLFIAAPRHDDRVNIGSKTLSGFGYRGHSFWDTEIFMLPVFIYTAPHIARNLLNYRYQRLSAAREKACANGYEGAQFPWESADTGEEVTPTWVPHYSDRTQSIRIWTGDIEIHISADIAYAACLYWKVTGDNAWFIERGAEIVLDTAKYWASRAEWNPATKKYEYNDVIGPDEYHDHVDNNFYTNYMARWNLNTALEVLSWLQSTASSRAEELKAALDLTPARLAAWKDVIANLYLPVGSDGLIEQFEDYFKRQDVDLAALEPRQISAQVYFGIEGCSETQILKQPDVLMLPYIMWDEFDHTQVKVNYDYYSPRTDFSYGSSLGPAIQAMLTSRLGDSQIAHGFFLQASRADLLDVRGNASDGIHGASAGGIWQAIVFGFAGLKLFPDHWEVYPCLPTHWKRLSFHFTHLGKLQTVDIQNPLT
jgi:kojibiose phosphorylase